MATLTVAAPSILDAIIAGAVPPAFPRPVAPPPAPARYFTPTPEPPAPPAARALGLEAKRAAALARFTARRIEAPATPAPAKPFHCPVCGTGSLNRLGIVSHLRQIHHFDKAARDSAMATAGI